MIQRLCIALLVCHLAPLAHAEDRRTDPDKLTIMTFNVEFMWDGIAPEEGSSRIEFDHRGNPELAAAKMARIAEIIRKADADIVSLDEVENLDALKLLNDQFLDGMGYKAYLKNGRDTFTGQDVGILTRIDPDEPLWREDRKGQSGDSSKAPSKNYIAKFTVGDEQIALIGLHLYSRPTDSRRMHDRQAQARSILRAAMELDAEGYHVIIAGDINDYDGSKEASDHQSNQPISTVVAELRGMDPATEDDDLINVAQFVPKKQRYTCHWDKNDNGKIDGRGELTSIDHILIAPELAKRIDNVEFVNRYNPAGISDHFPIVVTIDMPN